MATKSKKRNPAGIFILFFLSSSLLIATIIATVWAATGALLFNTGIDAVGLDYKQTRSYRHQLLGGYLIEATNSALNPELLILPDNNLNNTEDNTEVALAEQAVEAIYSNSDQMLEDRFASEGGNLSWLIKDVNGNIRFGNTDAQTPDRFISYYEQQLDESYRNYNFFSSVASFAGYDHLIVLQDGQLVETINTRTGQNAQSIPLMQSGYASWYTPEMREQLARYPQGSGPIVCLAVKSEGRLVNNTGAIYQSYYNWFLMSRVLVVIGSMLVVALVGLLTVCIKRKSFLLATDAIARWSGWVPLEGKILLFFFGTCFVVGAIDYLAWQGGASALFLLLGFWVFWTLLNDLRHNGKKVFAHNIPCAILRFLKRLESKYPFCAKMKRRLVLMVGMELVLWAVLLLLLLAFGLGGAVLGIPLIGLSAFLLGYYIVTYNKQIDELAKVIDYAEQVRTGAADQLLVLPADSDYTSMAETLNDIHSGMARMVDARVKSDQMKAELVTNVSHDLKTPLTSIINYVDLLSKEELSPAFANDYVKVLAEKSDRLKNLVQDLFEISKAQSGAIDFLPENLNVVSLLEQTVAEMDARASNQENEIRLQFSQPQLLVCADGKKLHRVFENLLGNALKYSMAGTRVYVSMQSSGHYVQIIFKNVAGYEMNFTEQEIVERFQRGDTSRTNEGSGLGLAIAKSFVELNGGTLRIELDGDLFKAMVTLPIYQPGQETASPAASQLGVPLTAAVSAAQEACAQEVQPEDGQPQEAPPIPRQMPITITPVATQQPVLAQAVAQEQVQAVEAQAEEAAQIDASVQPENALTELPPLAQSEPAPVPCYETAQMTIPICSSEEDAQEAPNQ